MKKILLLCLLSALALISAAQSTFLRGGTTAGSSTVYTISITSYPTGGYIAAGFEIKFDETNSGAATLNINGNGALPMRLWDGDSWELMTGGELNATTAYRISLITSGTYFQVHRDGGSGGAGSVSSVTGDGVNNTDPANPAISFPTLKQAIEKGNVIDSDQNISVTGDTGFSIGAPSNPNALQITGAGTIAFTLGSDASGDMWRRSSTGIMERRTPTQVRTDIVAQPLATYLTQISGLSPSNDDILQLKAGAYTNRTMTQLMTDLPTASTSIKGGLSSSDWNTFNGKESALTFSTGLTRATNTVTVNTSQNIAMLSNLTSNGLVTTSGGSGALSITATTGSGSAVLSNSPTLVNPALGTPVSGVATNITGLPVSTGIAGLGTGIATALGVNIGSAGAPVLFNGVGGTPSSIILTNATGTASGLTAGSVTTNANLTGPITSTGNATAIASQTGTGTTFVMSASPALTGSPTAPTQSPGDNSTKLGTTAYTDAGLALKQDNLGYIPLNPSNNLSDVSNAGTSLINIGGWEKTSTANTQTGDYTLQVSDFSVNTTLYMNSSTNRVLTIPLNATAAIPVNRTIIGRRIGSASITFTPTGGVSVTSAGGSSNDPGRYYLWALTKTGTDSWYLDNGGTALGIANQLLGVDNAGAAQEYKTVSNGITAGSGTVKLGGALTADTQLSGAFSLGIGAPPSAKLHIVGLGTTTGELLRLADNTPTTRLTILDNGKLTWASTQSGSGVLGLSATATISSSANSQTINGYDFVSAVSYGANTGVTANLFRFRDSGASNDYWSVIQNTSGSTTSQIWNSTAIYDFKNSASTSIIRNSAAALSLRGGTTSTTKMLQFTTTVASSTNNNAAFNFTGNTHDYSSAVTRTNTEILNDASITSVNGSTLTYNIFDNSPSFALGTSTATLTGYNYNPTLTSGTFTHYAMRVQSGLSAFGHTNTPTAFMDLAASTTASSSLRIRSGSAPTSPNDGDIWQDGTNIGYRGGSTSYEIPRILKATATLNFPSTAAGTCEVLTITLTGAAIGDIVDLGVDNASIPDPEYIYPTAWVSATNTVTVKGCNIQTVTALDPASGSFTVAIVR